MRACIVGGQGLNSNSDPPLPNTSHLNVNTHPRPHRHHTHHFASSIHPCTSRAGINVGRVTLLDNYELGVRLSVDENALPAVFLVHGSSVARFEYDEYENSEEMLADIKYALRVCA